MYAFETLIAEHCAIQRSADVLLRLFEADPDAEAAHGALAKLARELDAHLLNEDSDIYPQLIADKISGTAHEAAEAIRQFETLADDWRNHAKTWTQEKIAQDWSAFADRTRHLVDRLLKRIRVENELLYPLALRSACIRLRDR